MDGSNKWVLDNFNWEEETKMGIAKINNKEFGLFSLSLKNFKINQFKVITESTLDQEDKGFKFPLMLFGIGLAFLYQLFCRDQKPARTGYKKGKGRSGYGYQRKRY